MMYDNEVLDSSGIDMKTEVEVQNPSSLAVWHQINNRPEFLSAYKSMS